LDTISSSDTRILTDYAPKSFPYTDLKQFMGRFLSIIGHNPNVSKSHRLLTYSVYVLIGVGNEQTAPTNMGPFLELI
jgi:hypothetical protein